MISGVLNLVCDDGFRDTAKIKVTSHLTAPDEHEEVELPMNMKKLSSAKSIKRMNQVGGYWMHIDSPTLVSPVNSFSLLAASPVESERVTE